MAGANTIIRVLTVPLFLLIVAFVSVVGVMLYEPLRAQGVGDTPAAIGWSSPNFMFFMALGLIGMVLVMIVWLVVAPVRNDVRQEVQPPRRPPF